MSLRTYTAIKRYLHVSDTYETYQYAEWLKVEPLNSGIRGRFQDLVVPASDETVDEVMIRFHGRSKHSRRMPKEPVIQGFKIFAICQRGYAYNRLFHSRIRGTPELDFTTQFAATRSVVYIPACSLAPSHNQGYHFNVYMENHFTTIPLLSALRYSGIARTGAARANAFPSSAKRPSDSVPWNTRNCAEVGGEEVCSQDQKTVQMLTTLHSLTGIQNSQLKLPSTPNYKYGGAQIRRTIAAPRMIGDILAVINDYKRVEERISLINKSHIHPADCQMHLVSSSTGPSISLRSIPSSS